MPIWSMAGLSLSAALTAGALVGQCLPPRQAGRPAGFILSTLRRQMYNALSDPNCVEIAFNVVPSTAVSIDPSQRITTQGNEYIYLITIKTKRVDEIP